MKQGRQEHPAGQAGGIGRNPQAAPPHEDLLIVDSSDEETLLGALEKLGERMSEEGESSSLAGMEGELLLQEEEGVRWLC